MIHEEDCELDRMVGLADSLTIMKKEDLIRQALELNNSYNNGSGRSSFTDSIRSIELQGGIVDSMMIAKEKKKEKTNIVCGENENSKNNNFARKRSGRRRGTLM